jgi:hypothetical protein
LNNEAAAQNFARLNDSFTNMTKSINQEIPKANAYIAEVNGRVGAQGPISPEMTVGAVPEAERFLAYVKYFDDLANRLPVAAQTGGKGP